MIKVLVIGGGGREHALAWKISRSPRVEQVFIAPGNAGTALEPKCQNIAIDADASDALLAFAIDNGVAFTVVGPEAPLIAGIVDRFEQAGQRCFGPNRAAAQLEGSKAFSKAFMLRHGIPTARYQAFTELDAALAAVRAWGTPVVIKADGLAAGKGVIIAHTGAEAAEAVHKILGENAFGEAGRRLVIEEFLRGEEASFIVMVDGQSVLPMASSQDHKARDDGDTGPNTGGMGAYSPALIITPEMHTRVMQEIIQPTLHGLRGEGILYRGFLYAGLMIDPDGNPRVLEYNCRFGDPETQPIMLRLRSDLVDLIDAALAGRLAHLSADWDSQAALGVVLAAGGYPNSYAKGEVIDGLPPPNGSSYAKVFHAGTGLDAASRIITAGGRVLCATALGANVSEAQRRAYALAQQIRWNTVYYRRDIGYRAIARERR